jgi:hypothetical protein
MEPASNPDEPPKSGRETAGKASGSEPERVAGLFESALLAAGKAGRALMAVETAVAGTTMARAPAGCEAAATGPGPAVLSQSGTIKIMDAARIRLRLIIAYLALFP